MPQLPTTVDLAIVRTAVETNVIGVIRVTNAMLPLLRRSASPRIVNMSSSVGSLTRQTTSADRDGPDFRRVRAVEDVPQRRHHPVRQGAARHQHPDQRRLPWLSPRPTSTASAASAPPSRARRSRSGSRPCPTTARPAGSSTTPGRCPGNSERLRPDRPGGSGAQAGAALPRKRAPWCTNESGAQAQAGLGADSRKPRAGRRAGRRRTGSPRGSSRRPGRARPRPTRRPGPGRGRGPRDRSVRTGVRCGTASRGIRPPPRRGRPPRPRRPGR